MLPPLLVCVSSVVRLERPRPDCATAAIRSAAFATAGVRSRRKNARAPACSTKISGACSDRLWIIPNNTKMGGPGITGRTRPTKVKKQASAAKRKRDDVDVEKLEAAVAALVRHLQSKTCHRRHADKNRTPSPARTKTSPTSPSPSRPKQALKHATSPS
jgi:hypothetical protein